MRRRGASGLPCVAWSAVDRVTPAVQHGADLGTRSGHTRRHDHPVDQRKRRRRAKGGKGADRNRTGVNGFAGRCVATPPRRQAGKAYWGESGSFLPRCCSATVRGPPPHLRRRVRAAVRGSRTAARPRAPAAASRPGSSRRRGAGSSRRRAAPRARRASRSWVIQDPYRSRPLASLPRVPRAISSAGRAPSRQGGGHWFEPSIAHLRNRATRIANPPAHRKPTEDRGPSKAAPSYRPLSVVARWSIAIEFARHVGSDRGFSRMGDAVSRSGSRGADAPARSRPAPDAAGLAQSRNWSRYISGGARAARPVDSPAGAVARATSACTSSICPRASSRMAGARRARSWRRAGRRPRARRPSA